MKYTNIMFCIKKKELATQSSANLDFRRDFQKQTRGRLERFIKLEI